MTVAESKQCSRCLQSKPLSAFYRQAMGRDGHKQICKECLKPDSRSTAKRLRETYKAQHTESFYAARLANPDANLSCKGCCRTLHVSYFGQHANRSSGFCHFCKDCERKRVRRRDHRQKTLVRYGLTLQQYAAMLSQQNGVCAICRKPPPPDKNLAVDHCHAGGHVRGLLCTNCNTALGLLGDDATVIARALDYALKL